MSCVRIERASRADYAVRQTEAIGLVVAHAGSAFGPHGIEANIQPETTRPLALVHGLRFRQVTPRVTWVPLGLYERARPTVGAQAGALKPQLVSPLWLQISLEWLKEPGWLGRYRREGSLSWLASPMQKVRGGGAKQMHEPCYRPTRHFVERAEERCLDPELLRFILIHGDEYCSAGAIHLTVRERELPPELRRSDLAERARDWIIVVAPDGSILTCYRRRGAVRFLRQKTCWRYRRLCRDVRTGDALEHGNAR